MAKSIFGQISDSVLRQGIMRGKNIIYRIDTILKALLNQRALSGFDDFD